MKTIYSLVAVLLAFCAPASAANDSLRCKVWHLDNGTRIPQFFILKTSTGYQLKKREPGHTSPRFDLTPVDEGEKSTDYDVVDPDGKAGGAWTVTIDKEFTDATVRLDSDIYTFCN